MNVNEILNLPFENIVGIKTKLKENGNWEKEFYGFNKKWTKTQAENFAERKERDNENVIGVMKNINLKNTGFACIDIDEDLNYFDMINAFPILKNTLFVKGNTKGGHFYFKTDWNGNKNIQNCFDGIVGDILGEKVFERYDKEWLHTIQFITSHQLSDMVKSSVSHYFEDTTDSESCTESIGSIPSVSSSVQFGPFERAILDNISCDKYTSYMDWLKFIWAIKCTGFSNYLDIADEYSRRVDGYVSREDVEEKLNNCKDVRIGWGYLVNCSKKSNFSQHKVIMADKILKEPCITEYDFAMIAVDLIDTVIRHNDQLYYYENGFWTLDDTNKESIIKKLLLDTLKKYWIDVQKLYLTYNLEDDAIQKRIKKISHCIIDSKKHDKLNNTHAFYRMELPNHTESIFDKNPYLFCFNNKAYNLLTCKEHTLLKEDYVLLRTGNDYVEPTNDQIELVKKLLTQIFPNPEIHDCYLSILFQGMTGIRTEKFFLANGSGRNGKGLLNELFMELIKNYGYILPVDVLTSKKDIGTGANPQIANCHKKRFILSREPEEGAKIRTSTIKEMTGGCEINARQLYSGKCQVIMEQIQMLECNQKPQLSGTMNDAIQERIVDIPFVSLFTTVDEADEENHIYPVNTFYKSEIFREQHRCALFHVLLSAKKELYIPAEIKAKSKEYVLSSDEIYTWMEEKYEKGTDDDIISAKDLYNDYCASSLYLHLSKEEKRLMSKKNFTGLLKSSIGFRGKYREDQKMINGVRYWERIHGWKKQEMDILSEL